MTVSGIDPSIDWLIGRAELQKLLLVLSALILAILASSRSTLQSTMPSSETKALPSTTTTAGSTTEEIKPKCKACCACPETKQVRDACIMENGEADCQDLIEAHKKCMREQGFKIWFSRAIILTETEKQSEDFVMRIFVFFSSVLRSFFFYVLSCFLFPLRFCSPSSAARVRGRPVGPARFPTRNRLQATPIAERIRPLG